jgi:copper chaperone
METVQFNVPSLACSACSSKIQEGVGNLNGVNSVNVNVKTQMVSVEYLPDRINTQEIKNAISSMGYEVVG